MSLDVDSKAKTYFIKPGYRINDAALTNEVVSGQNYWNDERLKRSLTYQYPVYMTAREFIRKGGIARVIDVGCGVATKLGALHRAFPEVEFVGIDQPSTIEFCQAHHRFGRWLADDLEHPDGRLSELTGDLVICSDVIEHMSDPDVLLRYLKGRVRPGGMILLSTPERDALRGRSCCSSPNAYHVREWNRQELSAYLRSAGFSIVQHWMQLPVKCEFSNIFFTHVVKRALSGRPVRWNQVCLLEVA